MAGGAGSSTSPSRSTKARSSASSARTEPARRRRSGRCWACCDRPSGRAALFGLDAWQRRAACACVGLVRRLRPGYLGELTAAEQLDYVARLRRLPRGAWRPVAERFELDPTVPIKRLSRGNRQKVGVVQAFMGEAPLLILDEPTTGLDPLMQREFLAAVRRGAAAGRTVFLSSHNLPEVERSCDRVGIIRDGRLAKIVTVQALLAGHWRSVNLVLERTVPPDTFDLPNVRVASITARDVHLMVQGDVNPLLRKLARIDLLDVSITTPEIEDVFLRLYSAGDQPTAEAPTADEPSEIAR